MTTEENVSKSNKKRRLRIVLNILVIAVLLAVTVLLVLREQELPQIIRHIREANPVWLLGGVVLLTLFVCSESVIFHYLFRRLRVRVPLRRCILYSYVGFFFCAVTPSASGGQPVQLLWMTRDDVDAGIASLVLIVVTIAYKLALIFLALVLFLACFPFVMANIGAMLYVFLFGLFLNLILCALLALTIWKPNVAEKIAAWLVRVLCKIRLLKDRARAEEKLSGSLQKYRRGAELIRGRTGLLIRVFGISVLQRLFFFTITYMVYRSFGLTGENFWEIISLQVILSLALDILPFPGGIGANEGGFLIMYMKVFGEALVVPGMLLSRGINYYLLVLVGGIITVISYAVWFRRKKRQN